MVFVCIIMGNPLEATFLYIFPRAFAQDPIVGMRCKIFDVMMGSFVGLTLHAVFYVISALQCVYHRRLGHLLQEAREKANRLTSKW